MVFLDRLDFLLEDAEGMEDSAGFAGPDRSFLKNVNTVFPRGRERPDCAQTYSGLSISAGGFPFFRDLGADWWLILVAEEETASGNFCLLDRRPEDQDGNALLGLLSAAGPFSWRGDGVVAGAVGTYAAVGVEASGCGG